jgi:hypothetical protein
MRRTRAKAVERKIAELLSARGDDIETARIDRLRYFVAADLTRLEIETLRCCRVHRIQKQQLLYIGLVCTYYSSQPSLNSRPQSGLPAFTHELQEYGPSISLTGSYK